MEQPHSAQYHTRNVKCLLIHHEEAKQHQAGNRNHDTNLCFSCHSLAFYIGFQIIFVQLRTLEPTIQFF